MPPTYTVFGRIDEVDMAAVDRWAAAGVRAVAATALARPVTITSIVVKQVVAQAIPDAVSAVIPGCSTATGQSA